MLAVAGGKGGCGKTTTTLGLALAAGRAGRSALAVDADLDVPDLHRLAGLDRAGGGRGVDRPGGGRGVDDGLPDRAGARGRAPPGSTAPEPVPGAENVAVAAATDDGPAALARHRGVRDHVFVDCPPGGGPDAVAPMRAADRTLVVTTPAPAALRDAAKTAAMSRAVGTPIAGAVLTRTDDVDAAVESLVEAPALGGVPDADRPLRSDGARSAYDAVLRRLVRQRD